MKNCFTEIFEGMQKELGYSNKYIAENLGVTEEHISMIKNGKRLPTPKQFTNMAEHMGFVQVGLSDDLDDEITLNLEYLTMFEKLKVLFYIQKFL